ncbi:MAG TPA: response regulator [Thermoanaerobaculia bacterium]|nr:response regulator [Thermoanaerobaculia bacterium]
MDSRSVLIVDDDPVHRTIVFHMLRAAGYSPESVEDGVDALEALKWKDYLVIILDLMMDVVGGDRLLDHLEQTRPGLMNRIIVLTGIPNARERLAGRPVFDVLEKPFKQQTLLEAVARCAEANQGGGG